MNKFKLEQMDRKASKSDQNSHNMRFMELYMEKLYKFYLESPVSIRFLRYKTKLPLHILGAGVRAIDRDTAPLSWGPLSLMMEFAMGANKHPFQEILTLLKKGGVAPDFALLSFQLAISKYFMKSSEYKELDLLFREIVKESDNITEEDYVRAKEEVLELMKFGYEEILFDTKKFRPLIKAVEKKIFGEYSWI